VPDGAVGGYRLEGLEPTAATVGVLAARCAELDLLIAELRTTGASLEERYLELTDDGVAGSADRTAIPAATEVSGTSLA
jgi:hypothetical protein